MYGDCESDDDIMAELKVGGWYGDSALQRFNVYACVKETLIKQRPNIQSLLFEAATKLISTVS